MSIDVKNPVGVVNITVTFFGDIDGRRGQNEFVDISGRHNTSMIVLEIGKLKFDSPGDDVDNICGTGLGAFTCCQIEKSFFVTGDAVKDISFLRFNPSPAVFPYPRCRNEFTATVEYCDFDDGTILV